MTGTTKFFVAVTLVAFGLIHLVGFALTDDLAKKTAPATIDANSD